MAVEQLVVYPVPPEGRIVCHCLAESCIICKPRCNRINVGEPGYGRLVLQKLDGHVWPIVNKNSKIIVPGPGPGNVTINPMSSLMSRPDGNGGPPPRVGIGTPVLIIIGELHHVFIPRRSPCVNG